MRRRPGAARASGAIGTRLNARPAQEPATFMRSMSIEPTVLPPIV
jgi:hypothetical protein